jgi:hypothetical protein
MDVVFLTHSTTSSPQQTTSQANSRRSGIGARHRHGLEVKDEGHLKDIVVILFFAKVFYIVRCFS